MRRSHRIAASLALAALPLLGGLYLWLAANADAELARREAQGVAYAGQVLPELASLAKDGTVQPNAWLRQAAVVGDPAFGTGAISKAYDVLKAEVAGGAHPAAARHAAAMLVARIHEASGLAAEAGSTEDAAQLIEVPQAANAAPLSPALMQASRFATAVGAGELKRLEDVLAEFRTATEATGSRAEARAYAGAATVFADRIAAGLAALPDAKARAGFDWDGLDAAHDAFQDAALAQGQAAGTRMQATLDKRLAEAQSRSAMIVAVASVLAVLLGAGAYLGLGGQLPVKEERLSSMAGKSGAAGPKSRGNLGARMANTSLRARGGVKLTTAISAMVFLAVAIAISAVLFAVYLMLEANTRTTAHDRLTADLRIAAAILEVNLPNSDIYWTESGQLERIEAKAMPKFRNHDLIDTIGRVTGDTATLFVLDPQTQDFVGKTTTLTDETGERLVETPLAKDGPAYPVVLAGGTYEGQASVLDVPYYAIYQPVLNLEREVIGLVYIGTPKAEIDGVANRGLTMLALVGAVAVVVIGALAVFASSRLTRPIPRLSQAMQRVASGDLDSAIPYVGLGNEIGDMARNVEVFRANALRVQELTEDERLALEQRRAERAEMMLSLQQSFGQVVDAATEGDFSHRVEARFADDELNRLAQSVNRLVDTVEAVFTDAGTALAAIADTDLTYRMTGEYGGALGKLRDDTNHVAERLAAMVSTLKHTSGTLKTATAEILSGANDLSERTTRQAATIEETSAAMMQLADTVRANAEKAEDARHVAEDVTRSGEEGGAVMLEANHAMERITQSSGKISNIIGMIDDIAFQTNLLALNASVEAARAGEAGKGFAVVAVEVRRLAQSAAQASSEVKVLIEQSGAEVQGGTRLVAQAAGKLDAMMTAARRSSALMATIAEGSRHQAGSIDEVNMAVRQLDEMTQHNAALVEQINAAIEQTEAQAGEVDSIADVFTLGDKTGRRAA
ncbi:methyl-accepting chemotaxis protein [Devosia sp. ZB163]|uniref:methyl-accepting chemotaxis protein n=1 Tax=Devosia sp. ZB163 TaxID=3025938 RepID=UPI00236238D3|nr:methyl-accepting chemotaxis protein [Devosia sp. ZB163]MDC9826406.1 methyl-accepting chemotaxis protein [Devosia sp. ZB163]